MLGIGFDIDTTAVADVGSRFRTARHATGIRTEVSAWAFNVAIATVVEVILGIDAQSMTIDPSGSALASSVDAGFATGAFVVTATTVEGVGFCIDAGAAAIDGGGSGATGDTMAVSAALTRGTFITASTAVIEVIFEVFTGSTAVRPS